MIKLVDNASNQCLKPRSCKSSKIQSGKFESPPRQLFVGRPWDGFINVEFRWYQV